MTDRTGAFLAQLTAFLEERFSGEIVIQCKHGQILQMDLKQRIRPAEDGRERSVALFPNSSSLTAVGR